MKKEKTNWRLVKCAYILLLSGGVIFWTMIVLSLFGKASAQQYEFGKTKLFGLGITCIGGFVDGMVEGYEFQGRKSFERKWGVDPYGFWGSRSYESINTGWERQFGVVDFYHVGDDLRKAGYVTGGIVIGLGGRKMKQKKHHYVYDFIISFAVSGMAKAAGMYYIREIDSF